MAAVMRSTPSVLYEVSTNYKIFCSVGASKKELEEPGESPATNYM
jgi:hypothetical protein